MKEKVDFFTRYDRNGASSRYRYFLYADRLAKEGWQLRVEPFFSASYLEELYRTGKKSRWAAFSALLRRWWAAACLRGVVVLEYELLPFIPYAVEQFLLRNTRYVLNFDDNVWEKYASGVLHDKYDNLVRQAAGVIVANDFLAERIRTLQKNWIKIPTVVDLEQYPTDLKKFDRFTIVWIGTPVTYRYLLEFADVLKKMAAAVDFELLVIAKKELAAQALEGVRVRYVDWSAETETEYLGRGHVGIMPLTADPFSCGKSAFKLIQYQAAGLPSIGSPVGENNQVIHHGENGFLADSPEQWVAAIKRLAEEPRLYQRMHNRALELRRDFSLEKYYPIYRDFLREILAADAEGKAGSAKKQ